MRERYSCDTNSSTVYVLIILCMFGWLTSISAPASAEPSDTLRFCIDHYPPNHVFPAELSDTHPMANEQAPFGFAIDAMQEISNSLDLLLETSVNTPFKRCLGLMKLGETDIMWGLLANEERQEYMHLFEYTGSSPKVFLTRRDQMLVITGLNSLQGLVVGVVRGYKYFPEFDREKDAFTRWPINTINQGIQLLLLGRIDVLIIREQSYEDLVKNKAEYSNQLVLAPYRYDEKRPVHIALSKQSPHIGRRGEIQQLIEHLKESGRIDQIREQFNKRFYGPGKMPEKEEM